MLFTIFYITINTQQPPRAQHFQVVLLLLHVYRNFDIVEHVLQKLEKYANHLETIVEQRTLELLEEKERTEMLLHRMLPP